MTLRTRKRDSHKGENGRVLVIGGSEKYVGAVYLSSMAAFRSGADYVVVAAPEKVAWTLNKMSPDLITVKLNGSSVNETHTKKIKELSKTFDVLLIGSGIGSLKSTQKVIKKLCALPMLKVIDADAIRAIRIQDIDNALITPHQSEFLSLLKNSGCTKTNFKKILRSNVILLKGKTDSIFSSRKTSHNRSGSAGMTVAGTGDILAGLSAGILAQEKNLFKSAQAAAKVSGHIGQKLQEKFGFGFMASDMLMPLAKEVYKLQHA